ncbi:hypothetical protein [Methanosarcina mazei]|uniref:DUF1887 family protein n=1 Tax=Methanosarcina mazei TaxID=2209 RepID=A0A0F8KMF1_METMZ|nr:hypothetical protein [Methanosarcina mazei]KKG72992.1 hypothetical protein DU63_16175 [Methanosarcina mazei]KKH15558.1 hypothetical protein DU44_10585 [Methanosarcina mazei]KKH23348.1 hypothetical protein DU48_02270 [Methanosarcina mazei]KKH23435.1 hypothetical protein DU65_17395 [Methanosarcina mazei]
MNTSTGSTPQKDLLHNGFPLVIKPLDYVESEEIKKLIFAFEDDRTLRNFFIKQTFSGLSSLDDSQEKSRENNTYQYFFDFIRESRLLPKAMPGKSTTKYYTYISNLSNIADQLFLKTISRPLAHVCEKAEKIGIITPDIFIDSVKHKGKEFDKITFADEEHNSEDFSLCTPEKFCFYKISESLYEIWIKPENTGLFLEVWVYHTLKEHFKSNEDIEIFHSVHVYNKGARAQPEALEALIESNVSKSEISEVTELDVLITKNNKPVCIIECKNSEANMYDVLKLYGVTQLLKIDNGIMVTNKFHKSKGITDFENIQIVSDVINDLNFPKNVVEIVEEIVGHSTEYE